ncbi:MAG: glycosyltransferase [Puniceicoccaceae bacterium]
MARGDWDLVVFHSTYIPAHWGVAAFLRKGSIPYVVTPRSGMTAGARALKRWKKRAGDLLGFRRMVRGARAVHYLTEVERANSPRWCASSFVVGNGVDLPEWDSVRDRVREEGVIRCLFIGRYAIRAKGLDRLLDAVEILHRSENTPAHPRWQVTLRGRGTPRDEQWLRHEIQTRNLDERVELGGPVADREKKELFSKADIFIHVSRFEGEPMAVLEALAHGVPAIVTEGTGLAEPLVRAKAGWRVGETGSIIADQLSRFEPARIPAYGRNARTFAESRSWNNQAAKTLACYQVMNRLLVVPELYYPEQ